MNRLIPIVFGAVHKPKERGLVNGSVYSGNHLTGIATEDTSQFDRKFTTFTKYLPNTKNILILSDNSVTESKLRSAEVATLLTNNKFCIKSLAINKNTRVTELIKPSLSWADAIVVPRQTHLMAHLKELAEIVCKKKIPLIAANAESVRHGIPLGYGMDGRFVGEQTATQGLPVLESNTPANEIKIENLEMDCKLYLNREVANFLNLDTTQIEKRVDVVIYQ